MNQSAVRPIRDRYDRHVRHAQLRLSPGVSQHSTVFAIEEGLRLISLPGEDQGRTYYFRKVNITGLSSNNDRATWQAKLQEALEQKASQAVHGVDADAGLAEAVYFRSEQEALEILLHRMLARQLYREWFWPQLINKSGTFAQEQPSLLDVIERLRAQPASWIAFATSLFSVPSFDVLHLLHSIPAATIEHWLVQMDSAPSSALYLSTESMRPVQPAVHRALQCFGRENSAVIWLGALAALLDSPAHLAARTAVLRARIQLQQLMLQPAAHINEETSSVSNVSQQSFANFSSNLQESHKDALRTASTGDSNTPEATLPRHIETSSSASQVSHTTDTPQVLRSASVERFEDISHTVHETDEVLRWQVFGLHTKSAGIFFLLNAMQHISMDKSQSLFVSVPQFAPRVLLYLVLQSGTTAHDPVALWLHEVISNSSADTLPQPLPASFWPGNFTSSTRAYTLEDFVRIWSIVIRRWCWKFVKMSASQIIQRDGLLFVNRTDLDISLPIEAADVRIRKTGLDLDPGWLSWFGHVVRFHYRFRGELYD